MKTTTKLFTIVALLTSVFFASCKKEKQESPVASFSFTPNDTTTVDATITFTNTSTNADTYLWNFGDGTTSTAINPVKEGFEFPEGEFSCFETFTITLTATKNGKSSSVSKPIVLELCR